MVTQVIRVLHKSCKNRKVRVKVENHIIRPELSLVLPVLACTI